MTTETLEDRLAVVERELAQIKSQLTDEKLPPTPTGWEKMFGIFADSEGFEEATRLGQEYRESRRPQEDAEATSWFFWTRII